MDCSHIESREKQTVGFTWHNIVKTRLLKAQVVVYSQSCVGLTLQSPQVKQKVDISGQGVHGTGEGRARVNQEVHLQTVVMGMV